MSDAFHYDPARGQRAEAALARIVEAYASWPEHAQPKGRIIATEFFETEEKCYCVCHSPFSSCPVCEHCDGQNEVGWHHLQRYADRLGEVVKLAKAFSEEGWRPQQTALAEAVQALEADYPNMFRSDDGEQD